MKIDQPATILIADNSRTQRLFMLEMLASDQIEIILACDGHEAIELYKQTKPDICVFEVVMPNLDGIAAAKQILSTLSENEYVPVIFITYVLI